jgi:predicted phosphodiesterase
MEWIVHGIVGILGAVLAVWIFGHAAYSWGLVRVRVSVAPARYGDTAIVLTPIGEITARTHRAPVRLTVQLDRLHLGTVRRMAKEIPDASVVLADLEQRACRSIGRYALRLLLLALAGGTLASIVLLRGSGPWHLFSGFAGLAITSLALVATVGTYDRGSFASPRYTGPLAEAPGAVRFARDGLARLSRLRGRMDTIAASLARFYASLGDSGPRVPAQSDLRVLHISDLHNNPVAIDFVERLARHFRVDLIVNTGDVTDYGTEVEEAFIQRLRQLPVPQLLVAGNHDSQTTLRTLDREAEMRVLDGESVVVHGVRFAGWPDPVSKRQGYGRVNPSSEDLDRLRKEIRDEVASLPAPPHVLLVHNHRVAEQLGGAAPVILYGHSHRPSVRRTPRSIFINAGTTGGAGARYFEARNGVPYSAVVLHFSREEPGHLLAADLLQVHGPEGEFVLQRHMLNGTTNRDEHFGPAPPPARAGQP